jgi:hypothetical protein
MGRLPDGDHFWEKPVAQGWCFSRPAAFRRSPQPQVWEKRPALRYGLQRVAPEILEI